MFIFIHIKCLKVKKSMLQGLKGNKVSVYSEILYISHFIILILRIKTKLLHVCAFGLLKPLHEDNITFAQINNTDNKNSNKVTKICQARYFLFKDITMEHKVVAYHLNNKIHSPNPTVYIFSVRQMTN